MPMPARAASSTSLADSTTKRPLRLLSFFWLESLTSSLIRGFCEDVISCTVTVPFLPAEPGALFNFLLYAQSVPLVNPPD